MPHTQRKLEFAEVPSVTFSYRYNATHVYRGNDFTVAYRQALPRLRLCQSEDTQTKDVSSLQSELAKCWSHKIMRAQALNHLLEN
jgi:hypothetical protein